MKRQNVVPLFIFSLFFLGLPLHKALAHCDTLEGPVIKDAKSALEKKDVTPVLKWVKKDAEGHETKMEHGHRH